MLDVRLLMHTFLRIFKIPERWLHSVLGVGRIVTLPALADPPSVGDEPAEAVEGTPAGILLQIGSQPNPGSPVSSNGHGKHGNGHAHGVSAHKHRGKRTDIAKPR